MGTISTYILMITLVSLEVYSFSKKEFTFRIVAIVASIFCVQMFLIRYSNVNYMMVLVFVLEAILLNIILFIAIMTRFQTDEE